MFASPLPFAGLILSTLLAVVLREGQPPTEVAPCPRIALKVRLIAVPEELPREIGAALPNPLVKVLKNDPKVPWAVVDERQLRSFLGYVQGDRRTEAFPPIRLMGENGRTVGIRMPAPGFPADKLTQVLDWGQDDRKFDPRKMTDGCELRIVVRPEAAADGQTIFVHFRARLVDETKGPLASVVAGLSVPLQSTALVRGWHTVRYSSYNDCPAAVRDIPVVNRLCTRKKPARDSENVLLLVTPQLLAR